MTTAQTLLTGDDVAALRAASEVSFHQHDGKAWISAGLSDSYGGAPRLYTGKEQRLFPEVSHLGRARKLTVASTVRGYGRDGASGWNMHTYPMYAAFRMINTAQYDHAWLTVARLVRAGDALTLAWTADNNNGAIRQAGLCSDELHLVVDRTVKGKPVVPPLTFMIGRQVGRNDTARMVRRLGMSG